MAGRKIFSVCGMCTVRCPIQVEVNGDSCIFCRATPMPRGSTGPLRPGGAGPALVDDDERPQYPLIRTGSGARESGAR